MDSKTFDSYCKDFPFLQEHFVKEMFDRIRVKKVDYNLVYHQPTDEEIIWVIENAWNNQQRLNMIPNRMNVSVRDIACCFYRPIGFLSLVNKVGTIYKMPKGKTIEEIANGL